MENCGDYTQFGFRCELRIQLLTRLLTRSREFLAPKSAELSTHASPYPGEHSGSGCSAGDSRYGSDYSEYMKCGEPAERKFHFPGHSPVNLACYVQVPGFPLRDY